MTRLAIPDIVFLIEFFNITSDTLSPYVIEHSFASKRNIFCLYSYQIKLLTVPSKPSFIPNLASQPMDFSFSVLTAADLFSGLGQ